MFLLLKLEVSPNLVAPACVVAGMLGCALLGYLSTGASQREAVLMAFALGTTSSFFLDLRLLFANHSELVAYETALWHPLYGAGLSLLAGIMGGRLGAQLSSYSLWAARGLGRAFTGVLVLAGVLYIHGLALAALLHIVPGLVVLLGLLVLALSPSCAGAVLRLLFRHQAEQAMVGGLASIGGLFIVMMLVRGYSLGLASLVSLVLVFLGATVYTLALPGLVAVRVREVPEASVSSVPKAIVVQDHGAHKGDAS